ncbi:MAG: sugar phosphate isomerase/epimerase [Deltaproteobacteria bacterium]|nr:sugar phosphate isomerase/epimerase [Deltaproteobacteria bacterium]
MIIATSPLPYRNPLNNNYLEQIAQARRDGFSAYELHACRRGQRLSEEGLAALSKTGMTFSVHANYMDNNLSSCDPVVRKAGVGQIKADILFAKAVKAGLVVVHPGCRDGGSEAEAFESLNQSLRELLPFACQHHIVLALENMDGSGNKLCSTHHDLGEILVLHPALKLTIDFAHIGMTHQDIMPFLSDFRDRIAHFHISGFAEGKPHPEVPLQASQIDFGPYLHRIRDWDMMITIEISDRRGAIKGRDVIEACFLGTSG